MKPHTSPGRTEGCWDTTQSTESPAVEENAMPGAHQISVPTDTEFLFAFTEEEEEEDEELSLTFFHGGLIFFLREPGCQSADDRTTEATEEGEYTCAAADDEQPNPRSSAADLKLSFLADGRHSRSATSTSDSCCCRRSRRSRRPSPPAVVSLSITSRSSRWQSLPQIKYTSRIHDLRSGQFFWIK